MVVLVERADTDVADVEVQLSVLALVPPVAPGDALAPADDAADAAGELDEVTALDAPALGLATAEPLGEARAEPLGAEDEVANADAEGLTADDPSAAGEPLEPGVVPAGPQAMARMRVASEESAMTVFLMTPRRANDMPRISWHAGCSPSGGRGGGSLPRESRRPRPHRR